ncbi:MAG: SDR family oxidoreductase [Chloroflexi bacterium]|jgi:NAD(P)-dependent dehydrogenase (short-subunit alcohol dehydrogenase family)|nr:SDR family oxidoreductase [Chloroflexota bacterium]
MLKDKVIIITGASSGIGRATALALAKLGAKLGLAARNYAALSAVADQARQLGAQAIAVPTDVTQKDQVADLVSEVLATFGRIDGLVNCAGVGVIRPIEQLTEEDIDRTYAVNTKGVILVSQAVGAAMLKTGGGRIVTPVGTMGRYVMRGSVAYSASKWGAVGALKAMATEWQRSGIGISLLYLGGVNSPFWDAIEMKVQRDKMLSVEDAAQAIVSALQAPAGSVLNELVLQPDSHQFI